MRISSPRQVSGRQRRYGPQNQVQLVTGMPLTGLTVPSTQSTAAEPERATQILSKGSTPARSGVFQESAMHSPGEIRADSCITGDQVRLGVDLRSLNCLWLRSPIHPSDCRTAGVLLTPNEESQMDFPFSIFMAHRTRVFGVRMRPQHDPPAFGSSHPTARELVCLMLRRPEPTAIGRPTS